MKHIGSQLQTKTRTKANSERAWLIGEFVDELTKEAAGTKFKPPSPKLIAIKVSHLNLESLYAFLSLCRDYKNRNGSFGKYFHGALKIK